MFMKAIQITPKHSAVKLLGRVTDYTVLHPHPKGVKGI